MAQKIGVYFDESAIGPYFDYEELADSVQKKWGDLCPVAKSHALLPGQEGIKMIEDDIAEEGLDGVLICGSSPRADWDAYMFEGVQVERVNLREQVVLCYEDPEGQELEASEEPEPPETLLGIVMDYINMGMAKLKNVNTPKPEIPEVTKSVMVLGGGWSGLTAAQAVADCGYDVVLVEKSDKLGGAAANMYKSTPLSYPYTTLQDTGVDRKIATVQENSRIKVLTNSTIKSLKGAPGLYDATVAGPGGEEVYKVGSVVLATGWTPQDTKYLEPLGYGTSKNIITSREFELMAAGGGIVRPSDNSPAKRVVFVLNTEKAEPKDKDMYCNLCELIKEREAAARAEKDEKAEDQAEKEKWVFEDMEGPQHLAMSLGVNSLVALKQSLYVREKYDDGIAYVLYDHMVVPGIHERFYKAAQDDPGVMMTKAEIGGIEEAENGKLIVRAEHTLIGGSIEIEADLVVLPTGIVPTTAKGFITNFMYRQGPGFPDLELFEGFADSNYICFPYETRRTGIYAAGSVHQPMMMDAAEDDAYGAALKAVQCIESANRGVSVHPRSGDLSYPVFNFVRCTQCKRCTEECPFGALDDDAKGTPLPNPTRCRRCGTCMGACPERVISFDNYGIGMLSEMIRQYKVPDDINDGGPRILILACENDAYPALDMAALRGHKWSPYVRIIPVRCLGSVNAIWIKDAMSRGTDGVMLLGCKYGDDYQCHFVKGSEICNRRKENIAETLNQLGIEPERVEQYEIAIDEYDKVPTLIEEFMDMVLRIGPNPFKGY